MASIPSELPQRLADLLALFPEAVRNGELDIDGLLDALAPLCGEADTYGLHWPGKARARDLLKGPRVAVLEGDAVRASRLLQHSSLLEGDNLDIMRWLAGAHGDRFSLICLDPPYNTGKEFSYDDDFRRRKRGQRHDPAPQAHRQQAAQRHVQWLDMIYPRLMACRPLLHDEGVLAAHIDEHEEHHLRILLDEVFGPHNHLGTVVWDKKNPKGDAKTVAYQHETILLYAKNRSQWQRNHQLTRKKPNALRMLAKAKELHRRVSTLPPDLVQVLTRHGIDPNTVADALPPRDQPSASADFAAWLRTLDGLYPGEAAYDRIDDEGEVYRLVHMGWPNKRRAPATYFVPLIHPQSGQPCPVPARGWRYPPETMADLLARGEIVFGRDHSVQPQRKYRLRDNMSEALPSILRFGGSDDRLFAQLKLPFFEHPKPFALMAELITILAPQPDCWILDPFAGSGSTGHAVWETNQRDQAVRRFVLIQRPERTERQDHSVTEICLARLHAVAKHYPQIDTTLDHLRFSTASRLSDVGQPSGS